MNQPTRPHKEKEQVPWCIQFSGRDLLTAAWGSKKGADLLYHFLHKASWEKKNKHENETLKDIKFQESTSKALEKSGLSLGCFHTYLKHFVSVGYISTEAYSGEYIVHTEVIQQAFSAAPEKPVNETGKRRQPRSDSFNLKDCNFVTLPREDYEMLTAVKDECFNLKEMFQSLKDAYAQTLAEMKEMFQSLKQNTTIHVAQEAKSEAFSDLQSNALRDSESIDLERKKDNDAIASPARFLTLELEPDVEDFPEAQPRHITTSYSQSPSQVQPTQQDECAASAGYMQTIDADVPTENTTPSQTEKPTKRNGRGSKKEKAIQPTLLDAHSKSVAYSDDEQRVFEWYCNQSFNHIRPEQDKLKKEHSAKLVPHVHSQEDMDDLTKFTKERLNEQLRSMGKKEVYVVKMGNLTNTDNLIAWLAQRKPALTSSAISPTKVVSLDDERARRAAEEEKNQRNMEANRQAAITRMQEKLANNVKLQNFELVMAVERYGLTLPPQYMAQYTASKQVAVSQ